MIFGLVGMAVFEVFAGKMKRFWLLGLQASEFMEDPSAQLEF